MLKPVGAARNLAFITAETVEDAFGRRSCRHRRASITKRGPNSMIGTKHPWGIPMLKSYPARLDGAMLHWIDGAPATVPDQPVMVVVDESAASASHIRYRLRDLIGKLVWRGDAVREQRAQRDAW